MAERIPPSGAGRIYAFGQKTVHARILAEATSQPEREPGPSSEVRRAARCNIALRDSSAPIRDLKAATDDPSPIAR